VPVYLTTTASTTGTWITLGTMYYAPLTTSYTVTLERRAELAREREVQRAERDREREEQRARENAAEERSQATLRSLLSPTERGRYNRDRSFRVIGSAGGHYLIRHGVSQNIERLNGRRQRLCAHPDMWQGANQRLPTEDAMIAQLLMLRFDEPAFLAIANAEDL